MVQSFDDKVWKENYFEKCHGPNQWNGLNLLDFALMEARKNIVDGLWGYHSTAQVGLWRLEALCGILHNQPRCRTDWKSAH